MDYDKPRTIFLEPSPEWMAHERAGTSASIGAIAFGHESSTMRS